MGLVLDEITRRVRAQLDQRGLVLWFDPERHYASVVDGLAADGLPVLRATDGYFALRRALDPWLDATSRPTGLVWVPRPEEEGAHALCELASVAAVMSPSAAAQAQNTRLASVLRAALPRSVAPEVRKAIVAQAEGGRLGVAELDALVSQSGQGARAALAVVFPTTDPMELALRHLASAERDAALVEKGLVPALTDALAHWLGATLDGGAAGPAALRDALSLHAFACTWRWRLGAEKPQAEAAARCVSLLAAWRDRLGAREEYVRQARVAQSLLGAPPRDAPIETLEAEESFPAVDDALAERIEAAMEDDAASTAHEARCQRARRRFWSQMEPARMERFALLESVARVRRLAGEVPRSLRAAREADVAAVTGRYTEGAAGEAPWSSLDTAHRHMERQCVAHDGAPGDRDARLDRLVAAARQGYAAVSAEVAERWLRAVASAGFLVPGVRRQRETFARHVRPLLDEGKVAYVLVDGLRYEMARELLDAVKDLGEATLGWTLGTLPSVTEVGMAALVPGAEREVSLDVGRDGRLGLTVNGTPLRNRKERMEHLVREVPDAAVFKLGEVVPTKRGVRERVAQAPLVVVTVTDELDGLGDGVNAEMARRFMDDVLSQVRRAVKVLFQLGVRSAVVTADHGHLFGESLGSDRQIPAPGGETVALHRRAWVGRGGASDASFARFSAAHLGLGGDLVVAVPWGTACFTAPGATGGYFHGGGSPQELVVPVLTVRSSGAAPASDAAARWTIAPTRPKLTALVATLLVGGEAEGLFAAPTRRVRVEVRDGRKVIGRPSAAAYGFDEATGELALTYDVATRSFRANTVTVRLDAAPGGRKVRVVLLDARTDQELAEHELDVALASW